MSEIIERSVIGFIDQLDAKKVIGWMIEREHLDRSVSFSIVIDNEYTLYETANYYRDDVLAQGHPFANVGFLARIPDRFHDGQNHILEFHLDDESPLPLTNPNNRLSSSRWQVGPRPGMILSDGLALFESFATVEPFSAQPEPVLPRGTVVVHVDRIKDGKIVGWAYDGNLVTVPVTLHLYVDGDFKLEFCCDTRREDVLNSGHPSALVGFNIAIPAKYYDDETHTVELRSTDGRRVVSAADNKEFASNFLVPSTAIVGQVDGLHAGAIRGWVLRQDRKLATEAGRQTILVTYLGKPVAQMPANEFRADVAEARNCEPNCGFTFVPSIDLVAGKTVEFRFWVLPGGYELPGSPYKTTFLVPEVHVQLRRLLETTDHIFTQVWALRSHIKALLPAEQFTLQSYDAWARIYYRYLKTIQLPAPFSHEGEQNSPLVSIICPTYRPRMKDFVAAVESVIAQTYQNWEMIIVDDCSGSLELNAVIKEFASRDRRIRPYFLKTNAGISNATNAALEKVRGKYVAFFDHDDLLVDRAIEFMVHAALQTGAKLLYCDEDKIDDQGIFSEVSLKPDWNYRLLLSQNYVCHLLFVERAQLRKAGPLRKQCDGAQDHDFILRMAEVTPPEEIHHVSEILYHWRKTPFSTAASGGSKAYAVAAGVLAVSDHLERKGLSGIVKSPRQSTFYEIEWVLKREPKVTIIIPYREHPDMTRSCVAAIRDLTAYQNYEIVLVDNWSTSDESFKFAAEMNDLDGVRVIRVEEGFNYSRINNIAVSDTEGEFLLFMNNDVFVQQRSWLSQMVGEALADDRVGIVGVKLVYPNGLVQHAGVVLGVGGIADHAHRGLDLNDPGYMARAICAQEFSAVTAACLLCRRDAFEKVGRFDEIDLSVAYNDVDLCLKIGAAGYRIVWTPCVVAEHQESLSRGSDFKPEHQARFFHENKVMEERWSTTIKNDKYYHRYFSRERDMFMTLRDTEKFDRTADVSQQADPPGVARSAT